ncbi:hypothetical protein [Flavobacterium aquiphilum]|uniref:hypothetical protein n=1 Tax=Flavobacterium aquiphilum TaxID=3003261 RepID=UPI00248082AC|nr:hypothetical protein [Flavobacterium aquiphilum]
MFKETSLSVVDYLKNLPEFTAVMQRIVDGNEKLFLFPLVASIENTLPLTTYVLSERTPLTKDVSQVIVTLNFWFGMESYDACCEFTDTLTDLIDDKFLLQSSSIEYNEETATFSGIINFSII